VHEQAQPDPYILARSDAERHRLVLQDQLLGPMTRSLFERAGLREGMRVLDVGSGAGGVALLAAEMVGSAGSVVGVEIDPDSVAFAVRRTAEAGVTNATFIEGDVTTSAPPGPFDAIVGRLVLMHVPDPTALLSQLRPRLRPGGVVAFLEGVMVAERLSQPESPTLQASERVRLDAARRVHANMHMGLDLRTTFLRAGLGEPDLRTEALTGGGPGWPGFELIETTSRSLLPTWLREGVVGAKELTLDGLAERIEREIGDQGTVMMQPHVGAWVRPDLDQMSGVRQRV
jgi:protein-L-isoaspartate O-methyltransferase